MTYNLLMLRELVANLGDLDQECKQYFLRNDTDLTSIAIGVAALMAPMLSIIDYSYYGWTIEFFITSSLVGAFVIFSAFLIINFRHVTRMATYESQVFAWSMFLGVATKFADFLQPERITENVLVSDFLVIAMFVLITNKFVYRIIPVSIITIVCIIALFTTDNVATSQEKYLHTITLILLNGTGIIVLSRNNRFKQAEYRAIIREKEARTMFEELAASDPLTGILNRRSFIEHTRLAMHRFGRYQHSFCLAVIDLDNLKQINDTHGHLVGDRAIIQFAKLMDTNKRQGDIFGRLGGDEFGFILHSSSHADALKSLARMQDAFQEQKIESPAGDFYISFSVGVTEISPEDTSPDDLLHRADIELYQSKNRKRNHLG
ncbi:MAG: GGDEF domain-containing protein [Anaerolineales bacterium]|nr:GGDEF domain-containing protein [Anaerolineales bacterium]